MSTVWESINTSLYECHEGHECFSYIFPFVLWINAMQFGWSVQGQKDQSQLCCVVCETSERPFTSKQIRTKLSNTEFYTENDLMMCFYWCYGKWRLLKTSLGWICKTIRDTRKISEFDDNILEWHEENNRSIVNQNSVNWGTLCEIC
jgi:hypothetical protein